MAAYNWDGEQYTETAGSGAFISKEAFNKLIYTDAVVFITGIREGISTYNGENRPQWLVDFVDPAGEEFTKGLGKGNAERDARMIRLQATLAANPGEPIEATPFYVGQRIEFGKPKVTA